VEDDDTGHKRSLTAILQHLKEHEPDFNPDSMMRSIEDIAVKAAISVQPGLAHAYRSCCPEDLENGMCF
jgi:tubulin polyglutamylase TTLL6/13